MGILRQLLCFELPQPYAGMARQLRKRIVAAAGIRQQANLLPPHITLYRPVHDTEVPPDTVELIAQHISGRFGPVQMDSSRTFDHFDKRDIVLLMTPTLDAARLWATANAMFAEHENARNPDELAQRVLDGERRLHTTVLTKLSRSDFERAWREVVDLRREAWNLRCTTISIFHQADFGRWKLHEQYPLLK